MRRSPAPRALRSAAALVACAAAVALADDPVDLEIGPNTKLTGTLNPSNARESFPIDVPRGAKVKAKLKRAKGDPTPLLEFEAPGQVGADLVEPNDKGAKVGGEAAEGGEHRFTVVGAGGDEGDYQLRVKLRPRKKFSDSKGPPVPPGGEDTFSFPAPIGATATVDLAPGRGSGFVPTLLDVTGPNDFVHQFDPPSAKGPRHRGTAPTCPATGTYRVRFRNDGEAGGWRIRVKLDLPRIRTQKTDIRDAALAGLFEGDQAVIGRLNDGQEFVLEALDDTNLEDTSIVMQEDAVELPTIVSLFEAENFFVDDDDRIAGPAIEFEPAGLQIDPPATVTIPFQAQSFDDPETELTVFVINSDTGELTAVPRPYVFDLVEETVSFQTGSFSAFQSTSPRDRPLRAQFLELEFRARVDDDFGGAIGFAINEVEGFQGLRTGNNAERRLDRHTISWMRTAPGQAISTYTQDQRTVAATVDIRSDEELTVDAGPGDDVDLVRGRSNLALLATNDPPERISMSVVLRPTKGRPTPKNTADDYHAFVWEFGTFRNTLGGLSLRNISHTFDLEIRPNAKATATDIERRLGRTTFPAGTWEFSTTKRKVAKGSVTRAGNDIRLTLPDVFFTGTDVTRLTPVLRGDAFVGMTTEVTGDPANPSEAFVRFMFLIRKSADYDDSALNGRSIFRSFSVVPVDRDNAPPGFTYDMREIDIVHDGQGGSRNVGRRVRLRHDDNTGDTTLTENAIDNTGTYSVESDGLFTEDRPLFGGALTNRRFLYLDTRFGGEAFGFGFGLPARPQGP